MKLTCYAFWFYMFYRAARGYFRLCPYGLGVFLYGEGYRNRKQNKD